MGSREVAAGCVLSCELNGGELSAVWVDACVCVQLILSACWCLLL